MAKWRYYSYDVWGNKRDGYDVNNVFETDEVIDIPNVVQSDKALITYLRNIGFMKKKGLRRNLIEIEGDEGIIYLSYNGKPDGELRKE
jgi:hypothetical protein